MRTRVALILMMCCIGLVLASGVLRSQDEVLPFDADFHPDVVELSQTIMENIFQDIVRSKAAFPELRDFSEAHRTVNADGFPLIRYAYEDERTGDVYSFGITIAHLDRPEFSGEEGSFNYGFPPLRIKFSGFQILHPLRTQFDLKPLLSKYGMTLAERQQDFLPLRIFVRPTKDVFKVGEAVEFDVILENVSRGHMRVRALGQETLYFLINNQSWGTNPLSGERGLGIEVLRAGDKKTLRFKGESFHRPQEIEVVCFYRMSVDGVNPIGKTRIIIEAY